MTTLASAIATLPKRCVMAQRCLATDYSISSPMVSIVLSAIGI